MKWNCLAYRLHSPEIDLELNKKGVPAMSITDSAREFFDACETGKGWEVCKSWCHDGATFSCQSAVLADTKALEGYTEWTKALLTPIPDGHYELKAFATDPDTNSVTAFSIFHGTQTGPGGPVPPTGNTVAAEYVYVMEFDGDKIRHMTKIWNDGHSLKALGWG
jgi:predicted ester cyclase